MAGLGSLHGGRSKLLVMACINLSNLVCHAVYSVLASFFPQEAKSKGMSDDTVGVIFAIFAAVIFLCSPVAGRFMSRHGKVWVYIWGLCIVSASTISFSLASLMPAGLPFATWCLCMRLLQGVGSAMEETAAYAIIAEIDSGNVSFSLGICEISTGLGYMVGPPLGGFLFSLGGFACPFFVLGTALLPAAALIYYRLPPGRYHSAADAAQMADVPIRALLRNPQVVVIALAAMLANSDYAFLEPTLGDHVADNGLAKSPDSIGMLFSVSSITYTLSCPIVGILASRERCGPRPIIVSGLLLQLFGFLLIGPSPLLQRGTLRMGQALVALVIFGVGESMSMTPVMDDMMHACGELADASVNSLSSLMASSFSLGQMIGPMMGSGLSSRYSFPWASTGMALVLFGLISAIVLADIWKPRSRTRGSYLELSTKFVPIADSAD